MHRRDAVRLAAAGTLGLSMPAEPPGPRAAELPGRRGTEPPGRLKQSVCRWPFGDLPDAEFFPMVQRLGFGAVDLLTEKEWSIARDHGLICSMGTPTERRDFIRRGLNDRAHHPLLVAELERALSEAPGFGVPNVIAMVGNREGRDEEAGLEACVEGLDRVKGLAERQGVTICLELLNSRVDHADFMMDRMAFGLKLMYAVNSPRVRLLYDIYHMQIMEGDVIRTIRNHGHWIGHYHTAGNPGRHELDPTQELNYAGIAQAIADTGFDGWLAHEFIPTRAPEAGLREARMICAG
ncbi:MAG: TIM barrel protein [Gemmatimonadetes bacterium]|nr:TIM barrel protein [Gemmatimonadota bacterium]MBK9690939.1 TIM barrel protein [Gemmatimonadota bacterium]